jgi:hypothetical protein
MAWTPSAEATYEAPNPLMDAIESLFDVGFTLEPLTRHDPQLLTRYVCKRRNDHYRSLEALLSRLPESFRKFEMGPTDADVIDTIMNLPGCDLILFGSRGAGKTSLLHFVEFLLSQCAPDYHFVIVSGRDQGKSDFNPFVRSLKEQFYHTSERAEESLAQHLKAAADLIVEDYNIEYVHQAIRHLTTELPETLHNKLVFVFDNLDQLNKTLVDKAFEVARAINAVKQMTTIITARPGTLMGINLRGSARAFFSFRILVSPPDVSTWLNTMNRRIAEQSRLRNFRQTLDNKQVDSDMLGQAMERFATLLTQPSHLTRDPARQH